MDYPTETVARAEYEIGIFERPAAETSRELLEEVKAWRFRFPDLAYLNPVDGIQPKG